MAIFIPIVKLSEDGPSAVYEYRREVYVSDPAHPNRLIRSDPLVATCRLGKATGQVAPLDSGGWAEGSGEFARVKRKLEKHWREGELPERTSWSA